MATTRTQAKRARQCGQRRARGGVDSFDTFRVCITTGKARFTEHGARQQAELFGGRTYRCLFCGAFHNGA